MANKGVADSLNMAWEDVSRSWRAAAWAEYHKKIFYPMTESVNGIIKNNIELEQYASDCIRSCFSKE